MAKKYERPSLAEALRNVATWSDKRGEWVTLQEHLHDVFGEIYNSQTAKREWYEITAEFIREDPVRWARSWH